LVWGIADFSSALDTADGRLLSNAESYAFPEGGERS
jgi:hypothetical protein